MSAAERAHDILRWIDFCSPERIEGARKCCRGRKDIDRMRQRLRRSGWAEALVSDLTSAARRRDLQRLIGHDYSVERARRLYRRRRGES